MTEVNFRKIPEPLYPEQELSSEPWYSIGEQDVFPEEFASLFAKMRKFVITCNNIMQIYFPQIIGKSYKIEFWRGT